MDPAAVWILRLALATLLGAAALHKAARPRVFALTLRDYRILPEALVPAAVPLIVSLEAGIAAALLVPAAAAPAAASAGLLMAVYLAAIAINLARGRRSIDCGCLGAGGRQPLSGWLLARNAALIFACALAALPIGGRALTWVDGVSILAGWCAVSVLFHATTLLVAGLPVGERLGRST